MDDRAAATGPLGWLDGALDALAADDRHRVLRHHASGADPWIDLETADGVRRVLHLCGNGYLGLATDPRVTRAAADAALRWGAGTGSARLVTGAQTVHRDLEDALAAWKQVEAVRLFSSGYLANLGVVTALAGRGDTIVSDELNHASIIDACRLSGAEVRVYRHADPAHAESLLADAPGRRLLVTDGVFSMDGDLAPLPALCDAAERHGAAVVVDDAHGSGVLGPDGRGTAAALGCEGRVHAIVATLSKALGSTGGYVAGSQRLVDWLTNRARGFIFDTALGAPAVAAALRAVDIVRSEPERRARVVAHARRLADAVRAAGWDAPVPEAAIVPVMIGDNGVALQAMGTLLAHDVLAVAIRPPTVPAGTARLRATLMATHTDADVDVAVRAFGDALATAA
jgi:8-amino-7-oxononanoate synthase